MNNLWPSDIVENETFETPAAILKEQAALLGEMTNHVVTAEVITHQNADSLFHYTFYLVGPRLGGYRYHLFSVSHDFAFYPVQVDFDESIQPETFTEAIEAATTLDRLGSATAFINFASVKNEHEFLEVLKYIFSSKKTRKVINTILALSRDVGSPKED